MTISLHLSASKKIRNAIANDSVFEPDNYYDTKGYALVVRTFDGIETDYQTIGYVSPSMAIQIAEERVHFKFDDHDPLHSFKQIKTNRVNMTNENDSVRAAWDNFVMLKTLSATSEDK